MKSFFEEIKEKCLADDMLFKTLLDSSNDDFESIITMISCSKRLRRKTLESIVDIFSHMKGRLSEFKDKENFNVKRNFSAALWLLEPNNLKALLHSDREVLWKFYNDRILQYKLISPQETLEQYEYSEDTVRYLNSLLEKKRKRETCADDFSKRRYIA
jgi:hypothetical protein|tara:strand:+ start:942 stop:1415 length:474 start_codon:yes stop_codon:yes gene_type:complete